MKSYYTARANNEKTDTMTTRTQLTSAARKIKPALLALQKSLLREEKEAMKAKFATTNAMCLEDKSSSQNSLELVDRLITRL